MAIVQQKKDDKQNQQGMNVLGQDSMQSQATPDAPAQQNQTSGGAFIGSGAAPQQTQPQQQSKKTPQGSGMFTNVRKYVDANKPQAQKIGQAVQQNVQNQTQQIGDQVQKQKDKYQQQLQENQTRLQDVGQFAQQQVQQAGQGQQLAQDDVNRFRQYATGQTQFDPGQINLSQQEYDAQKMARQAALADRAQGVNQYLQDTFGQDRYTAGQKSLDNLILGGDQQARRELTENVQQVGKEALGQVRDTRQESLAQTDQFLNEQKAMREQVLGDLTGQQQGLTTELDQQVEQEREALAERSNAFIEGLKTGQVSVNELNAFIPESQQNKLLSAKNEALDDFQWGFDARGSNPYGHAPTVQAVQAIAINGVQSVNDLLARPGNNIAKTLYSSGLTKDEIVNITQSDPAIARGDWGAADAAMQKLIDTAKGLPTENFLVRSVSRLAEKDPVAFYQQADPESIQRQNVITDEQLARQQALLALAGQEGTGISRQEMARPGDFNIYDAMRSYGLDPRLLTRNR